MGYYHLTIELIIDILAVFLGLSLVLKRSDNLPKFYWGIIAASIGIMFTWENIGWLFVRSADPLYEYTDILNIEKMLKWFVLASIISLFPLASLRPGFLTRFRLLVYLIPTIIITTVGICYMGFNGTITEIDSADQIYTHIDKFDIKLRLAIFALTIIIPFLYFICPVLKQRTYRRITSMMYLFIAFMFLLLGIYICFTLYINDIFFNAFGIVSLVFAISFSLLYIRSENPLSHYTPIQKNNDEIKPSVPLPSALYYEINNYLRQSQEYTNPDYNITLLVTRFEKGKSILSAAIQSGGHSTFREYITYLRLEHFKHEASLHPHKTIKELMYACGFTSRATFYRNFSEQYGTTPTKYIDNQRNKHLKKPEP